MKISALIDYGKSMLEQSNKENALFDTLCLLEQATSYTKTALYLNADKEVDKAKECVFKANIQKRALGEPLQYILATWEFMGMDFAVGTGVLIPRPETEILVELAIEELGKTKNNPVVFDLCAGTGCIGLSVAKLCTNANVYLIEKSPQALEYLVRNNNSFQLDNTTIVAGDILKNSQSFELPKPDIILSNPPYVTTGEMEGLQIEVGFEPQIALDGGCDGLDFYRAINEHWRPYLNAGGMLAVECGETQADKISDLFSQANNQVSVVRDYNKVKRFVLMKNEGETSLS